jgi:hypothetical protein
VFTITGIRVQHPESAFRMPGIGVQLPPESAFSFNRKPCSAWAGARRRAAGTIVGQFVDVFEDARWLAVGPSTGWRVTPT